MATVNQTLSCTATAVPIVQKKPTKIQNAIVTSVPVLRKTSIRTHNVTGTISVVLLKMPQKVLMGVATSSSIVSVLRFGIDSFDVVQVKLKWFVNKAEGWKVRGQKRFGVMVRGKPGGYWD